MRTRQRKVRTVEDSKGTIGRKKRRNDRKDGKDGKEKEKDAFDWDALYQNASISISSQLVRSFFIQFHSVCAVACG